MSFNDFSRFFMIMNFFRQPLYYISSITFIIPILWILSTAHIAIMMMFLCQGWFFGVLTIFIFQLESISSFRTFDYDRNFTLSNLSHWIPSFLLTQQHQLITRNVIFLFLCFGFLTTNFLHWISLFWTLFK